LRSLSGILSGSAIRATETRAVHKIRPPKNKIKMRRKDKEVAKWSNKLPIVEQLWKKNGRSLDRMETTGKFLAPAKTNISSGRSQGNLIGDLER
jgi:hypothetical protein